MDAYFEECLGLVKGLVKLKPGKAPDMLKKVANPTGNDLRATLKSGLAASELFE